jgi:hypothetical protein
MYFENLFKRIQDRLNKISTKTIVVTFLTTAQLLNICLGEIYCTIFAGFWMFCILMMPEKLLLEPTKNFMKGVPETFYVILFAPIYLVFFVDYLFHGIILPKCN